MLKLGSLFILFVGTSVLLCCKSLLLETNDSIAALEEVDSTMIYKVELGKHLFYDPILSRDSTISCATCHKQELAFTDGLPKAIGMRNREGTRNSPTLANVKNRPFLLWDGVNPSLESQVGAPIQEHSEFDFNILLLIERIKRNALYKTLIKKSYEFKSSVKASTITGTPSPMYFVVPNKKTTPATKKLLPQPNARNKKRFLQQKTKLMILLKKKNKIESAKFRHQYFAGACQR